MLSEISFLLEKYPAIAKKNWYKLGDWESPVLRKEFYYLGNSPTHFKNFFGMDGGLEHAIFLIPTDYDSGEEHEKFLELFFKQLEKDPGLYGKVIKQTEKICARNIAFANKLKKNTDYSSKNKLMKGYLEVKKIYFPILAYSFLSYQKEKINNLLIEYVLKKSDVDLNRADDIRKLLSAVPMEKQGFTGKSLAKLEDLVLLVKRDHKLTHIFETAELEFIGDQIKAESPKFLKMVDKYLDNYGWLTTRNLIGHPMTTQNVFEMIKNGIIKEDHSLNRHYPKKEIEEFKKGLRDIGLNRVGQMIINQLRYQIYLKTFRKEVQTRAEFYFRPIIQSVGSLLNLSYEEVIYLRVKEFEDFIFNGVSPDLSQIPLRKERFALVLDNGKIDLLNSVELSELEIKSKHLIKEGRKSEITGQPAYRGIVEGPARVIKSVDQLKDVQDGEIIVADMTNPNYTVALHKAVGFITNRGGMLCHAAVLSRELKKPCIIGTGNATDCIKNGDLITIDADNGKVIIDRGSNG